MSISRDGWNELDLSNVSGNTNCTESTLFLSELTDNIKFSSQTNETEVENETVGDREVETESDQGHAVADQDQENVVVDRDPEIGKEGKVQ